jgi:hypothetical protein
LRQEPGRARNIDRRKRLRRNSRFDDDGFDDIAEPVCPSRAYADVPGHLLAETIERRIDTPARVNVTKPSCRRYAHFIDFSKSKPTTPPAAQYIQLG